MRHLKQEQTNFYNEQCSYQYFKTNLEDLRTNLDFCLLVKTEKYHESGLKLCKTLFYEELG